MEVCGWKDEYFEIVVERGRHSGMSIVLKIMCVQK